MTLSMKFCSSSDFLDMASNSRDVCLDGLTGATVNTIQEDRARATGLDDSSPTVARHYTAA